MGQGRILFDLLLLFPCVFCLNVQRNYVEDLPVSYENQFDESEDKRTGKEMMIEIRKENLRVEDQEFLELEPSLSSAYQELTESDPTSYKELTEINQRYSTPYQESYFAENQNLPPKTPKLETEPTKNWDTHPVSKQKVETKRIKFETLIMIFIVSQILCLVFVLPFLFLVHGIFTSCCQIDEDYSSFHQIEPKNSQEWQKEPV